MKLYLLTSHFYSNCRCETMREAQPIFSPCSTCLYVSIVHYSDNHLKVKTDAFR